MTITGRLTPLVPRVMSCAVAAVVIAVAAYLGVRPLKDPLPAKRAAFILPDSLTPPWDARRSSTLNRLAARGWVRPPADRSSGREAIAYYSACKPHFPSVFDSRTQLHFQRPSAGRHTIYIAGIPYSRYAFQRQQMTVYAAKAREPLVLIDANIAWRREDLSGLATCVATLGRGRPVVFFHGGPSDEFVPLMARLREAMPGVLVTYWPCKPISAEAALHQLLDRMRRHTGSKRATVITADGQAAAWAARKQCRVLLVADQVRGPAPPDSIQRLESLTALNDFLLVSPIED